MSESHGRAIPAPLTDGAEIDSPAVPDPCDTIFAPYPLLIRRDDWVRMEASFRAKEMATKSILATCVRHASGAVAASYVSMTVLKPQHAKSTQLYMQTRGAPPGTGAEGRYVHSLAHTKQLCNHHPQELPKPRSGMTE